MATRKSSVGAGLTLITATLLVTGLCQSAAAQIAPPRVPLTPVPLQPIQQTPPTLTAPPPPLRGFVDLHTHPLANLAFAGKLLYGGEDIGALLPRDPNCNQNVRASSEAQALGHDSSTHGIQSGCGDLARQTIIQAFESQVQGNPISDHYAFPNNNDATGYPDFKDWPTWTDVAHQKMWVEWIRRSWVGGLRVMVALAVNNRTLADAVAGPGDGPDDDVQSADLQIGEIKAFVGRHADFMEVAYSSADVQRIVSANRLAVIVGVEIDHLGDFGQTKGSLAPVPDPTPAQVVTELDRLYNEGVRYIFPVHVLDNPFGATAAYEDLFDISNARESGHFWNLQCATGDGINYRPNMSSTGMMAAMLAASAKISVGVPLSGVPMPSCPAGVGFKNVGAAVTVNGQTTFPGLTALGRVALKEMMRLGVLIDIDHMSQNTFDSALSFAEQVLPNGVKLNYPVMSGHAHVRGALPVTASEPAVTTSERDLTATQYARIAALHGMMGVGSANLDAWEWLKLYRNTIITPFNNQVIGAFGTDTDGLALGMPPRPGYQAITIANPARATCISQCQANFCDTNSYNKTICSSAELTCENQCKTNNPPTVNSCNHCDYPPPPAVVYDSTFPPSSAGTRTWNYNTEGVVHYGMLPDFLRDVASMPNGADMVNNNFMYGADYFYKTWQIAESKRTLAPQIVP
jgi:Membrane dipeptidase (Peptidase family M19)